MFKANIREFLFLLMVLFVLFSTIDTDILGNISNSISNNISIYPVLLHILFDNKNKL